MDVLSYPGSLHNHTEMSNLISRDSINTVQGLIDYAIELGHRGIAFTEHESISNAIDIEEYAQKIKDKHPDFKIIRGNEIYLVRNGLNASNFIKGQDKYTHFLLLALDDIGHRQIRELSTRAWLRSYMGTGRRRVPTYYQDLWDIVAPNPGHIVASTACFRAGTQVETSSGWKNIEDIQSGDYVMNRYGDWEEVIEPTHRQYIGSGYEIRLYGNPNPLYCTSNHQFLVISNNKKTPRWVPAEDLVAGRGGTKHICLLPCSYEYKNEAFIDKRDFLYSWFPPSPAQRRYSLPDRIEITPELMRLFGLFLGDGCISLKTNPNINFSFNETEFLTYYNSFVSSVGQQLGISWSVRRVPAQHKVEVSSSSRDLIDLFYYLFGNVKAETKKVPERLRISKELDYELLFGYFLADGYFSCRQPNGRVHYPNGEFVSVSISKELSQNIYNILNQLHITSGISSTKERTDKNGVHHKVAWYVEGSNSALGAIKKTQPYSHQDVCQLFSQAVSAKSADYFFADNTWYRKVRIKSKTQVSMNEIVYCLNNTTHSFKCENVIVHNCIGGSLGTQLLRYRDNHDINLLNKIKAWCQQLEQLFGKGNFYLEMQPSNGNEQVYVNKQIVLLSQELNIPCIITTDSHYLKKSDLKIERAFLKSQNSEREVDSFYATTYMMSTEEIHSYMDKYIPREVIDQAFTNINKIFDRAQDYSLKRPLKIPSLPWRLSPNYSDEVINTYIQLMPTLEKFRNSEFAADRRLVLAVIEGIQHHPDLQNKESYDELELCLQDTWVSSQVNKAQWSAYFLNLQRILDECWESGTIVGCGRGSGVGFLLLYCLDITQINPLREKAKTFRFRFLNPNRVSVLDIDVDISGLNRAQVLEHIRKVYGQDHVANVLTLRRETAKSAILAAGRSLGIDNDVTQYISSLIPMERGMLWSLHDCMYGNGDDRAPVAAFVKAMTEDYPEIWEIVQKTENLIVGMGEHAGGVIFVDEPFENSTALMRAPNGDVITQFELHTSEKAS